MQLPEELNEEAAPLEDLLGARLSLCGGPARGRRSAEKDGGEGRRRRRMVAGGVLGVDGAALKRWSPAECLGAMARALKPGGSWWRARQWGVVGAAEELRWWGATACSG